MRFIECYIENFGGLHDYRYKFSPGLNVFTEANGYGKTTLTVFLKCMLYGMSDTRSTSLDQNERKKYLPWQGGTFGGSLTIEHDGKKYRIERSFAKKPGDDTFSLYDADTGRRSDDYGALLGETILGIDADGFERTLFLSEKNLGGKCENKSVSAKLTDLTGVDCDLGDLDGALKILNDERKNYQKRGGGEINDLREELDGLRYRRAELERLAETTKNDEIRLNEMKKKLRDANNRLDELNDRKNIAMRSAGIARDAAEYAGMISRIEENKREIEGLQHFFENGVPTAEELDEIASAKVLSESEPTHDTAADNAERTELASFFKRHTDFQEISSMSDTLARATTYREELRGTGSDMEEYNRLKSRFPHGVPSKEEADRAYKAVTEKCSGTPFFISALILAAASLSCGFLVNIYALFGILPAFISLIIGIHICRRRGNARESAAIFLAKYGSNDDGGTLGERLTKLSAEAERYRTVTAALADESERREALRKKLSECDTALCSFISAYPVSDASYEGALHEIRRKFVRYSELCSTEQGADEYRRKMAEDANRNRSKVESFLSRYPTVSASPLNEIKNKVVEYRQLIRDLEKNKVYAEEFRINHALTGTESIVIPQCPAEDEISAVKAEVTRLQGAVTLAENEYNDNCIKLEGSDALDEQIRETEERIKNREDKLDTVTKAAQYLESAKEQLTGKYIRAVRENLSECMRELGGAGNDTEYSIDTSFSMSIVQGGKTHATESFSRGMRDIFSLAVRLALTDSLYGADKPPVILDDPFLSLDDSRCASALAAVRSLAKTRQVLYFTCSGSRNPNQI